MNKLAKRLLMAAAVVACAVGLSLPAVAIPITTLSVGDSYYLGDVIPGVPTGLADELLFINTLISLDPGFDTTIYINNKANDLDRSGNDFGDDMPTATADGYGYDDGNAAFSGYTYLLAKYGAGGGPNSDNTQISHVWYVADLGGAFAAPTEVENAGGLSHTSVYNPVGIPDGGSTLLLVGAALAGIAVIRRKMA